MFMLPFCVVLMTSPDKLFTYLMFAQALFQVFINSGIYIHVNTTDYALVDVSLLSTFSNTLSKTTWPKSSVV